ncbi:MAG: replicative helicase, partial [Paenibacillus sp.]|nr:replicative helicase [Paenibacillus sp.]
MKPHNIQSEQAVIGSILTEASVIDKLFLKPEEFFHPTHIRIAEAFRSLQEQNKPVDLVTVVSEMGEDVKKIEGGIGYL